MIVDGLLFKFHYLFIYLFFFDGLRFFFRFDFTRIHLSNPSVHSESESRIYIDIHTGVN